MAVVSIMRGLIWDFYRRFYWYSPMPIEKILSGSDLLGYRFAALSYLRLCRHNFEFSIFAACTEYRAMSHATRLLVVPAQ